ncbi:MAG: hypothetical protein AABZ44_09085 [Elusimicrobiota bacterium]
MPLFIVLALLTTANLHADNSQQRIYGFHLLNWSRDGYGQDTAKGEIVKISQTGAGWVSLVPSWYMTKDTDIEIIAEARTPSDEALLAAAANAKANGLRVALKPHIDTQNGKFRGYIRPTDEREWFKNYWRLLRHYARLAKAMDADLLIVGTELYSMTRKRHTYLWKAMIADLRQIYAGPMTYSGFLFEWESIGFWEDLDFIGISAYFPMGGPGSSSDADRLASVWTRHHIPKLLAASKAHDRPVLFTELGISSMKQAHVVPWVYKKYNRIDPDMQSNYYKAYFKAFANEGPWFKGFLSWGWTVDTNDGGPNDHTHTLEGKPVLKLLESEFKAASGR